MNKPQTRLLQARSGVPRQIQYGQLQALESQIEPVVTVGCRWIADRGVLDMAGIDQQANLIAGLKLLTNTGQQHTRFANVGVGPVRTFQQRRNLIVHQDQLTASLNSDTEIGHRRDGTG